MRVYMYLVVLQKHVVDIYCKVLLSLTKQYEWFTTGQSPPSYFESLVAVSKRAPVFPVLCFLTSTLVWSL